MMKFRASELWSGAKEGVEVLSILKWIQISDKAKFGIGDFAISFTVLPSSVDKLLLHAGILPYGTADLEDKLKVNNKLKVGVRDK